MEIITLFAFHVMEILYVASYIGHGLSVLYKNF